MTATHRKLEVLTFLLGGTPFQDQLTAVVISNETDDAEIFYTYAADGTFAEAAEDSYTLELTFFADWSAGGISDYLWAHDGETVACQIDHLEAVAGEHVRFAGNVQIKSSNALGEVRTTEVTECTLAWVGRPAYTRP